MGIYTKRGHLIAHLRFTINRQVQERKITTIKCQLICTASRPKSLAVTKISKISESPDIWGITILREPQRHIKFSTNFVVGIARIRVHTIKTVVWMRGKRKSFGFFSFLFMLCQKLSKTRGYFGAK